MSSIPERIVAFNKGRLPEMLKLKYESMAESVFRFYRGTCHLFYEDLAKVGNFPGSPVTWICGDLHPENFGSFKGDNRLVILTLMILTRPYWRLVYGRYPAWSPV